MDPCMLLNVTVRVAFEVGSRTLATAYLHVRTCSFAVVSVRKYEIQ